MAWNVPILRVTQKPIVTAGLKCPPEICPMAVTMIPKASPCATAMPSSPAPGFPAAVRYWSAQIEPTPMKISVNVPMNSATSFCGRLYMALLKRADSTGFGKASQKQESAEREILRSSAATDSSRMIRRCGLIALLSHSRAARHGDRRQPAVAVGHFAARDAEE